MNTLLHVGYSLGPAQILAIMTLPTFGLMALIQKIKAVVNEKNNLKKPPHSCTEACATVIGASKCPNYLNQLNHAKAIRPLELFLKSLMCLVPIAGGILASRFSLNF